MAAVSLRGVSVRAAVPGEGTRIAELWRQLWDAHDRWGGYAATSDARVYAQIAQRLDSDAAVRGGQPILGRHVHLVASQQGEIVGQVEGWFDRQGASPTTPFTCEVRSLIVHEAARGTGAGRALLLGLEGAATALARGGQVILAAEVLEPNPALAFYAKLGYRPVAYSVRIPAGDSPSSRGGPIARFATEADALPVALLESALASRRRSQGDFRFDRPRALDATLVSSIAAHLAVSAASPDTAELVVEGVGGTIHGSATFAVGPLEPPFVPSKRAMLGRFAIDPGAPATEIVPYLIALARRVALARGAPTVELTDLPPPGSPLYDAAIAAGARPWSRVLCRATSPR